MAASRILLTGATGFLGSETLCQLLRRAPSRFAISAVVRGDDTAHARTRLSNAVESVLRAEAATACSDEAIATAEAGAAIVRRRLRDVEVIRADLRDPSLSLRQVPAVAKATHVLHCASDTSYLASFERSYAMNVTATESLSRAVLAGSSLERFAFVSSAYCCGTEWPEGATLREEQYAAGKRIGQEKQEQEQEEKARPRDDHIYHYTATKAIAEQRLAALADPRAVVVRPSVIVGNSRTGCAVSGSIFFAFRAVHRLGEIHWPAERRVDVVPVDWTASALLSLLLHPAALKHSVYHLSAGTDSAADWNQLAAAFSVPSHAHSGSGTGCALSSPPSAGSAPYTVNLEGRYDGRTETFLRSFPDAFAALEGAGAGGKGKGPGQGMRQQRRILAYAMRLYERFARLGYVFDNGRLLNEGLRSVAWADQQGDAALPLPPPPPFPSYLPLCRDTSAPLMEQLAEDFR